MSLFLGSRGNESSYQSVMSPEDRKRRGNSLQCSAFILSKRQFFIVSLLSFVSVLIFIKLTQLCSQKVKQSWLKSPRERQNLLMKSSSFLINHWPCLIFTLRGNHMRFFSCSLASVVLEKKKKVFCSSECGYVIASHRLTPDVTQLMGMLSFQEQCLNHTAACPEERNTFPHHTLHRCQFHPGTQSWGHPPKLPDSAAALTSQPFLGGTSFLKSLTSKSKSHVSESAGGARVTCLCYLQRTLGETLRVYFGDAEFIWR